MFSYIDRLRKKPLEERRRFAKAFTFFVVIAIAGIWTLFNVFRFGDIFSSDAQPKEIKENVNTSGIRGPYE